jgi:hypothetical protein
MKTMLIYTSALISTLIIGILVWIITYKIAVFIAPEHLLVYFPKRFTILPSQQVIARVVSLISMVVVYGFFLRKLKKIIL